MKAIVIKRYGGAEELEELDMPQPVPNDDQVLIEMHATSINPIDWKLRQGYLKEMIPLEFPIILGWDAAGKVAAVGSNVKRFQIGDRVFARPNLTNRGTYAEYIVTEESMLAKIPENVSYIEAASIPLAGLTAWQCLYDFSGMKRGDKVLIHAGAGGVGSLAIQIAKNAGAYVASTASGKNKELLESLGVNQFIDYSQQSFEALLNDYDIVLDTMGGDIQDKSFQVLKDGGKLVSIVSPPDEEKAKAKNIQAGSIWLRPNGKQLQEIADLMKANKLKAIVGHEFPLSREGLYDAHKLSESHHARGKIVIAIK